MRCEVPSRPDRAGADRLAALAAGVPLEDAAGFSSGADRQHDAASDGGEDDPDEADPPAVTERHRATTARVTAGPGPPGTGHAPTEVAAELLGHLLEALAQGEYPGGMTHWRCIGEVGSDRLRHEPGRLVAGDGTPRSTTTGSGT